MKLYIKTLDELKSYLKNDLTNYEEKNNWITVDTNINDCIMYSRFIERIYIESNKGEYNKKLDISLLDYTNFSLFQRPLVHNIKSVSSYHINVLLTHMNISIEDSFLDPCAGVGEVILETGLFLSKSALHTQKRELKLPPKKNISKMKLHGVVADQRCLKQAKENARVCSLKPKISVYSLDWLDVKFQNNQFDCVVSCIEEEDIDFLKDFFYQSEFVAKKIGLITKFPLKKKSYDKYVDCIFEKNLDDFYLYIFE